MVAEAAAIPFVDISRDAVVLCNGICHWTAESLSGEGEP